MEDESFRSVMVASQKQRQKKLCVAQKSLRGKAVYEDTNNIGMRLLEKQGWSVGKGIGKNGEGIKVPIFNGYKQDVDGLGYDRQKDDHWSQHDTSFNELLKQLNDAPDGNGADGTADPRVQLQSLEKSSEQSRSRVHYKKFTRGKDLSQVNDKDLACIFGKRSLAELNQPKQIVSSKSEEENEDLSNPNVEKKQVLGLTTITANISVHDYFKLKMSQRKSTNVPAGSTNDDSENANNDHTEETVMPKKKKNKKRAKEDEQNDVENGTLPVDGSVEVEEDESLNLPPDTSEPRKEKKKSKRSKMDTLEIEQLDGVTAVVENDSETVNDCNEQQVVSDFAACLKKGKRKREPAPVEAAAVEELVAEESTEPKKKKKQSKKSKSDSDTPVANDEQLPEPMEEVAPADEHTAGEVEQSESTESSEPTKKKKKSKKHNPVDDDQLKDSGTEEATDDLKASNAVQPTEEMLAKKKGKNMQKNETKKQKKDRKKQKKEIIPDAEPSPAEAAETEQVTAPRPEQDGKDAAVKDGPVDNFVPPLPIEGEEEEDVTCRVKIEIFKHVDETAFPGSNFGNIVGYRLTEDVTLIKKDVKQSRFLDRHRFQAKKETVSDQRKLQKLKKINAFTPV